jgi:monoamine oxidase
MSPPAARNRRRCVVIGGGLAGLAAAHHLSKEGWGVDVLEAQDRLGGRVLSQRFAQAPDLVCELGAEWIGGDHHSITELVHEFGLELQPHQYSFFFWQGDTRSKVYGPAEWCLSADAQRKWDRLVREYHGSSQRDYERMDKLDWWTKLEMAGFAEEDLLRRDVMDSTDFGESIRQTSAYSAASEYIDSNATDEVDSKIVGGNDRLVEALAGAIRQTSGSIHTGAEVTEIVQVKRKVTVTVADQRQFEGHACICTVPSSCLRHIRWSPRLPPEQQEAANELQYARIMKTAILYQERFWPVGGAGEPGFSVLTNRSSDFCFDSTHLQSGTKAILCSYAIGDNADDLASETDQALTEMITGDVREGTAPPSGPDPRHPQPVAIKRQPWQREPWVGGAYAFYRPGQWFTVRPTLQRPHGRVYFAGEHLGDNWQGFMEGAINTGQGAARDVLHL